MSEAPALPPMRRSILRQRIAKRQPVMCIKSNYPHPMAVELLGRHGVECLWLDSEHFPTNPETMALLVQACRGVDADAVVRVPNGQYSLAARMFDSGADAIMYPRCRELSDIQELVQWTRFGPVGRRGADAGVAAAGYSRLSVAQSMQHANENTSLVVQIETPESVEIVDKIAALPGVDLLFVGPGDLSVELGVECTPDTPQIAAAIKHVAAAAEKHGIAWGMPALGPDHAERLVKQGATLIVLGSDTSLLVKQIAASRAFAASIGIPFGRG